MGGDLSQPASLGRRRHGIAVTQLLPRRVKPQARQRLHSRALHLPVAVLSQRRQAAAEGLGLCAQQAHGLRGPLPHAGVGAAEQRHQALRRLKAPDAHQRLGDRRPGEGAAAAQDLST